LDSIFRNRWSDAVLIGVVALAAFAGVARLAIAPSDAAAPVAVIFAPGTSAADAYAAATDAGARILRSGRTSNIVIVVPDSAEFADRVKAEGAWIVADASTIDGCTEDAPR
jgi:hypothetical protein